MFNRKLMMMAGVTAFVGVQGAARAEDAPAAPAAPAAAPAAPAASPLAKLLDASGITVSSYIDTAYSRADRDLGVFSDRVFDSQNDSLTLHQAAIQVAKQPKEGFGGLINLTAGSDVPVFESYPNTGGQFDVTQAYGQYATGPLTVIAGKFTTLQGSEVIWAPSNSNYSRSILFGAIPFTHTGARATYAVSDTISLIGGINNGWDQVSSASRSKTIELGATLNPIKPLNMTISDYVGNASSLVGGVNLSGEPTGSRNSFNFVGTYALSDAASLGLEYLNVSQSNFTSLVDGSSIKAKYSGWALYGSYLFTPAYRLALRAETFDDKDGFHFGVADTKYSEFTGTFSWLASDNFELRGELRTDHATNAVFSDKGSTSKDLMTYALEALFKF
jgi:hypothetical protein